MKVNIYEEKPIVEKEREFLLNLVQDKENVELILVNPDGTKAENGILLVITKEMRLDRFGSIDSDLGLPLNKDGQLKLKGEDD